MTRTEHGGATRVGRRRGVGLRALLCRAAVVLLAVAPSPTAARTGKAPPAASPEAPTSAPSLVAGQATLVGQLLAPLARAPYAGPKSLPSRLDPELSQTYTLFLGLRLSPNIDVYVEPELAAGNAPGAGNGAAAYVNADLINQPPRAQIYLARYFARWRMRLGPEDEPRVRIGRSKDLIAESVPARRLVVSIGQLSPADLFDVNSYANDGRTQFLNFAFGNNLAYDYPQDPHGYSRGVAVSWIEIGWALRAASFQVLASPGGDHLSWDLLHDRGDQVELELRPRILRNAGAPTVVRLLAYRDGARLGRYADALSGARQGVPPDLAAVRRPAAKWGFGLNVEVPLADGGATGAFARLGWSDGVTEDIAYTEVDRTVSAGVQLSGARWGRRQDVAGIAAAASFASASHGAYLAAGGLSLRLGDGGLRGGGEWVGEAYYALGIAPFSLTADLQVVANPGFNRDRGPAWLGSCRVHVAL